MTIALPPDVEEFVEEQIRTGQYPDAASVLATAVDMLRAHERRAREDLEWLRRAATLGVEQLDRGQSAKWDVNEIKAEGRRLLAARKPEAD